MYVNLFPAEPSANSTMVVLFLPEPRCTVVTGLVCTTGAGGGGSVASPGSSNCVVSSKTSIFARMTVIL